MTQAKILGMFGPGGIRCSCCGGAFPRKVRAGKIRAARKRAKVQAIREFAE